jgi:hypothetical protein
MKESTNVSINRGEYMYTEFIEKACKIHSAFWKTE